VPRPTKLPQPKILRGLEAVTIAADEYAELLQCRRRVADLEKPVRRRKAHKYPAQRPWFERDPEVASFVRERLGAMHLDAIKVACLEAFGPERCPSRSGLGRFWDHLRAAGTEVNRL